MSRKVAAILMSGLLMLFAVAVGVSYAQEETPSSEPTAEATVSPEATESPEVTETSTDVNKRPWLGVVVTDGEDDVTITRVSANSPAEAADLQVGDVIVAYDETVVESIDDFQAVIEAAAPSDVVVLTVQRGDNELSVEVTLGTRADRRRAELPTDPLEAAERVVRADLTAVDDGYEVVDVPNRTRFDLVVGDVITAVNTTPISTADWAALIASDNDDTISLTVVRNAEEITLEGQIGGRGNGQGGHGHGGRPDGDGNRGNNNSDNDQLDDNDTSNPGTGSV